MTDSLAHARPFQPDAPVGGALRRPILALGVCLVAALPACHGGARVTAPLTSGHRLLFIGNSLTYTNDLTATVAAIAAAAGDTVQVAMVAGPNLALIDHINGATNALARIAEGGWDYVILQQGPTSTGGICQDSLVLWTGMFAPYIRAVGATPALFMVWPASDRLAFFDNVRTAYALAAQSTHGVFLPAGEAWRSAWSANPSLALYGPDGFHPSPMGTFLAALEIYERLIGRDVRTLDPVAFASGLPLAMPAATVRLLQDAAHQANNQFPPFASGVTAVGPGPGTGGGGAGAC